MENNRIASWWIKWDDLNWPNQDNLDRIRRRADLMAENSANAAMVFGTHFRWDYMPFWEILHDYLATVADELHQRGVKLFDHHSVNLVHRYSTRDEMRHTILHSGPHLPFSPSREAAETWEYNGCRLNDWRMISTATGKPLFLPQYDAEGFCYRNPEFIEAYCKYVKKLIADTGIDGLEADDTVSYVGYLGCGCRCCRDELRRRSGIELPPPEDLNFWGNWENPAWRDWIDLRYDSASIFHTALRKVLPEGFLLSSCCTGSTSARSNNNACDAKHFLAGCNYQHLEMVGNTPPYRSDAPGTTNQPVSTHFINAAHHSAAAREAGVRYYGNGYGFFEATANIIWAVNKCIGSDCWFSTLKGRLGLPDSILDKLPDDVSPAGRAFGFEASHPELFTAEPVFQLGVYFSYETRNHTCFGNLMKGYELDFMKTLSWLFHRGISAGVVLTMPEDTSQYKLLILPGAAKLTDVEIERMRRFTAAGGKIIATGPSGVPGADSPWQLPTAIGKDFWPCARIYFAMENRDNILWNDLAAPDLSQARWREIEPGVFQHAARLCDGGIEESLFEMVKKYMIPLPVEIRKSKGYLVTTHEQKDCYIIHLLAAEYHTEIDEELDAMRFHRSRVNLITSVEPVNVEREFEVAAPGGVEVYTPFNDEETKVEQNEASVKVTLPGKCSYAVIKVAK